MRREKRIQCALAFAHNLMKFFEFESPLNRDKAQGASERKEDSNTPNTETYKQFQFQFHMQRIKRCQFSLDDVVGCALNCSYCDASCARHYVATTLQHARRIFFPLSLSLSLNSSIQCLAWMRCFIGIATVAVQIDSHKVLCVAGVPAKRPLEPCVRCLVGTDEWRK